MAKKSAARRVTGALADATGRSDEELRLALTLTVVVAGLFAALRVVRFLGDLGSNAFGSSRR